MDPEIGRPLALLYSKSLSDLSDNHHSQSSPLTSWPAAQATVIRKREILAWFIIALQGLALCFFIRLHFTAGISSLIVSSTQEKRHLSINGKPSSYHEKPFIDASMMIQTDSPSPFFDPPIHHSASDPAILSRIWHSNGSPAINNELQSGSCWCSGDDYCMCTPSLAIDIVLTSGPDHIWMVQREDTGQMALMGGFTEVGETVEEAARRELIEEMKIDLPGQEMRLFGVYSDPKRDKRKHAVSVVFLMEIPSDISPVAGDDARHVHRVPLDTIDGLDIFIDHKTVIRDYMKIRERQLDPHASNLPFPPLGDSEPFKRSVCLAV